MELAKAIPIFKISSEKLAREYYVDCLGFSIDWEHRQNNYPAYLQVSSGELVLHLTEHEGDAEPGTTIMVSVNGIDDLYVELKSRLPTNKISRSISNKNQVLQIDDPFGNHIRFVGNTH
ncbi:glyoxalase superfamily protein [Pseudomonas sp. N3-W]|uniref:Glyoxalase superfamily protein n=1 Tax=Pseudomonas fungipugnans TaxID=3024217 RepID=A0ABT6QGV9_9PSED|nr:MULTISPECIES: glyoxalase superfamily protein [unclassified Pseudomonas]MDI2590124.1 glyoxalase superfamily protein [Pseudomonas sp. 681]UWF46695.1 glyoxalase superfamily protein [Pseudomonas sp. N3-W]